MTNVEIFKNELRNYRGYQERIASLTELINVCYYWLSNVTGVDPSKEPVHGVPNKDHEYKLRDEIERHEKNVILTKQKLAYIEDVLNRMNDDIKSCLISVYADKKPISVVCKRIPISPTGLAKRMNNAIKKALDN